MVTRNFNPHNLPSWPQFYVKLFLESLRIKIMFHLGYSGKKKKFPRGVPNSPNSWEQMVFLVSQSLIQMLFIKAKPKEHFWDHRAPHHRQMFVNYMKNVNFAISSPFNPCGEEQTLLTESYQGTAFCLLGLGEMQIWDVPPFLGGKEGWKQCLALGKQSQKKDSGVFSQFTHLNEWCLAHFQAEFWIKVFWECWFAHLWDWNQCRLENKLPFNALLVFFFLKSEEKGLCLCVKTACYK